MSIWKPRPSGWENLRVVEALGRCHIHRVSLYGVQDMKDLNSDANAFFNDRGEKAMCNLCPICSLAPAELAIGKQEPKA